MGDKIDQVLDELRALRAEVAGARERLLLEKRVWSLAEVMLWLSFLKSTRAAYVWIATWAPRAQCGAGVYSAAGIRQGEARHARAVYSRKPKRPAQ